MRAVPRYSTMTARRFRAQAPEVFRGLQCRVQPSPPQRLLEQARRFHWQRLFAMPRAGGPPHSVLAVMRAHQALLLVATPLEHCKHGRPAKPDPGTTAAPALMTAEDARRAARVPSARVKAGSAPIRLNPNPAPIAGSSAPRKGRTVAVPL